MLAYLIKGIKISAISIFALSSTTALITSDAEARIPQCGEHTSIVSLLEKRYGETPRGIGLVSDRGVMQVFVSPEKGTWTILMTNAQGQSCLLAAGKGWEELKQKAKDENA